MELTAVINRTIRITALADCVWDKAKLDKAAHFCYWCSLSEKRRNGSCVEVRVL